MSGYAREELLGKPHSIIRHPDMPRSVFRLFWNTISENQSISMMLLETLGVVIFKGPVNLETESVTFTEVVPFSYSSFFLGPEMTGAA